HLSGSRLRDLLYICSPFIKRACIIFCYVVLIMSVRLWLMGGSMPLFSEQDNPASFSPQLLTRVLTYSYLLSFNAWLLLAPIVLCYDWQVGSIPLVETLGDVRNVATVLLAVVMVALCLHCVFSLQWLSVTGPRPGQRMLARDVYLCLFAVRVLISLCLPSSSSSLQKQESREVLVGLLFLVFPFIPASNLFFRVGFVVAERVLYMPSMGYCILVAHGLGRLGSVVGRWGTTVLSVSMLLLLLLFSWKTVQQNHVWLSREALFRSGIQTLPHNAKVHYNFANFLKDSGRHQEAIHHYTTALRLYPRHASAMNNLGTLTRSPEEAESYYRKALDINPQHNRALFNLGNLLKLRMKLRRRMMVVMAVMALIITTTTTVMMMMMMMMMMTMMMLMMLMTLMLMLCSRSQGKEKEAEALLKDSIHFGPHFADAYSSLASLYAEQKRFAEANEVYLKGIENCPDSSDLHNNYGVFLVDTGEGELAAAHYQQAVRLKPAHYVAMVNLGRLLRSSNENKEAESWYKRALQAQVLAMAGRTKEAEKMTLDIISREGSCIECYRLLSAIYSKRGNFTESYKLAVELKPDQSQAWMNMGGIQHIKGDYAAARMYYQRALLLSPGSKLLKENLAKLDRLERRLTGGRRSPRSHRCCITLGTDQGRRA
ncbi:hypothetical protein INR49_002162, partial [Caranx melampygus]